MPALPDISGDMTPGKPSRTRSHTGYATSNRSVSEKHADNGLWNHRRYPLHDRLSKAWMPEHLSSPTYPRFPPARNLYSGWNYPKRSVTPFYTRHEFPPPYPAYRNGTPSDNVHGN